MQQYGQLIAKYRKEHNLTQEQLANILNISKEVVISWEENLLEPDLSSIKKLSQIFNKPITAFFEKEETISGKAPKENMDNEEKLSIIKKSLIKYGIISVLITIILVIISLTNANKSTRLEGVIGSLVIGLLIFTTSIDLKLDGPSLAVYLFFRRTIRMPGVIFTLSIDGLISLIFIKIIFGFISLFLSVSLGLIGLVAMFIVSFFTFVPTIIYRINNLDTLSFY